MQAKKEVRGKTGDGPDLNVRDRWEQPGFVLLPELRGERPIHQGPLLLC
jgi:hypothetical protein